MLDLEQQHLERCGHRADLRRRCTSAGQHPEDRASGTGLTTREACGGIDVEDVRRRDRSPVLNWSETVRRHIIEIERTVQVIPL